MPVMRQLGAILLVLATTVDGRCAPDSCTGAVIRVGGSSADCPSIQRALDCVSSEPSSILIAPGFYREQLRVTKPRISLLGLGPPDQVTVGTDQMCGGSDPSVPCGTLQVLGDDFVMSNITLVNAVEDRVVSAGDAFALEVAGDRAAFYHSRMLGKDDTVFTGRHRVYFRNSWMNGSTDFTFGQGSAVYDRCTLLAQPGQFWSFITAHAGNLTVNGTLPAPTATRTAFLIQDSRLPCVDNARKGTSFLGRPWGPLATVIFKNTWMDNHIAPAGWTAGKHGVPTKDVVYGEFNSSGPGANPTQRASWSLQLNSTEAEKWTVGSVLQGWVPPVEAVYPTSA